MDNKKALYFFEMASPFIIPLLVLVISYIGGLNINRIALATLFLSSAGGTVLSNCYSLDSVNKPIFIPLNVIIGFVTLPIILVFDNLSTKINSIEIYYAIVFILCAYSLKVSYKNLKFFLKENESRKQEIFDLNKNKEQEIQTIINEHETITRDLQRDLRQQKNTISTLNKKIRVNEFESLLDMPEITNEELRAGFMDSLVIDIDGEDDYNDR